MTMMMMTIQVAETVFDTINHEYDKAEQKKAKQKANKILHPIVSMASTDEQEIKLYNGIQTKVISLDKQLAKDLTPPREPKQKTGK